MGRSFTLKQLEEEPRATALLSEFKDLTDPKYIGPGNWYVIHSNAIRARETKEQDEFIKLMEEICRKFPCKVCSGHCKEYMKFHPISEYRHLTVEIYGVQEKLGLFIWSWRFHNAVNQRLGKPIMSWETAYNLYSEEEPVICSRSCSEASFETVV